MKEFDIKTIAIIQDKIRLVVEIIFGDNNSNDNDNDSLSSVKVSSPSSWTYTIPSNASF